MDGESFQGLDSISANPVVPPAEQALVTGLLRHDRKAAAELLHLHADAIYTYLFFRLTPRTTMLDDLFQEVFVSAWQGLDHFRAEASLKSWLLGIARHKVEDYYRSCLRKVTAVDDLEDEDEPAAAPLFDESIDSQRRRDLVQQVLQELPEPYRVALLWRYWERCSAREMADMTGKTEKAVERLLARARASFKERWNRAGF